MKTATMLTLALLLTACAAPEMAELRAYPPTQTFVAAADIGCLFEKGKEHASGYNGFFTWNFAEDRRSAWFRSPHTLLTLSAVGQGRTEVELRQGQLAATLNQNADLLTVLRTTRCT